MVTFTVRDLGTVIQLFVVPCAKQETLLKNTDIGLKDYVGLVIEDFPSITDFTMTSGTYRIQVKNLQDLRIRSSTSK